MKAAWAFIFSAVFALSVIAPPSSVCFTACCAGFFAAHSCCSEAVDEQPALHNDCCEKHIRVTLSPLHLPEAQVQHAAFAALDVPALAPALAELLEEHAHEQRVQSDTGPPLQGDVLTRHTRLNL